MAFTYLSDNKNLNKIQVMDFQIANEWTHLLNLH